VKAVGSRFLFEGFIQWRVSCGDFITGDVLWRQGLRSPKRFTPRSQPSSRHQCRGLPQYVANTELEAYQYIS
jgi:hypothetical protein